MKHNRSVRLLPAVLAGVFVISCMNPPAYAKSAQAENRKSTEISSVQITKDVLTGTQTVTQPEESELTEEVADEAYAGILEISEEADSGGTSDDSADIIASGSCGDSLTWVLDGEYTLTISGSGGMDSWDWYGDIPWYDYVDSITAVVLDDGVTSVGDYAFYGCDAMASINIPDTVTEIGAEAFYSCSGLKSIAIPDSVTVLEEGVFYACTGLTEITIPETVTTIDDYVFGFCIGLTDITIPASVTEIGSEAFYRCSSLEAVTVDSGNAVYSSAEGTLYSKDGTELLYCPGSTSGTYTVPEGVTAIGPSAFSYCTGVTAVSLPESLASIGDCAFYYCTGLTAAAIPDGVLTIGESAFDTCTKLEEVTLGDGVETIGKKAFYNCAKLTGLSFGSAVTAIDSYAFAGDTALAEVTLPESLLTIGNDAFRGCAMTSLVIPDTVESIGAEAFLTCASLETVDIGSNVTSIGSYAFEYCTSLVTVTIPDSVESLGKYVFYGCTGLENAILGDGITSVNNFTFAYCTALSSITIPDSVTSIGPYAFAYCEALADVCYGGSACQWESVAIDDGNDCLTAAELHCTTGHSWDEGTVTQEATTTEEGVMTYTCTVCGATKTEAIAVKQVTAPTVALSAEQGTDGKIRLVGTISDYENSDNYYEVTGHGFVYVKKTILGAKSLTVNTTSRTKVTISGFSSGGTYIYSMAPKTSSTVYAIRAWVTYTNSSGKTVYVYSNTVYTSYDALAQ